MRGNVSQNHADMRKSVIIIAIACAVIAGAVVYVSRHNGPLPSSTVTQTTTQPGKPAAQPIAASIPEPAPAPATNIPVRAPVTAAALVVTNNSDADAATNSIAKTVDALLAAAAGPKHALFEQLRKNGQLDAAIAELQKRAAANSTDPEIPTTLGEALLNKIHALKDAGDTDINDIGILAMQADKQFNDALQEDPKDWEAQFVKCASLYNWPPDARRDNDVVQRLSSLIDQQESMSPQPNFASSYVLLGDEYMKMGQPQEAMTTWQIGAKQFPADPALQAKIAGAAK